MTQRKIVKENAQNVAMVIKNVGVCGRIYKVGRRCGLVKMNGTQSKEGIRKLEEFISDSGKLIDVDERDKMMLYIVETMKLLRRSKRTVVNTTKLIESMNAEKREKIVREALAELYRLGRIKMESRGKVKKWSLSGEA